MTDSLSKEKRLYKRLVYRHVGSCIVEPRDVADVIGMDGEAPVRIEDAWMTEAEFEALPEFES